MAATPSAYMATSPAAAAPDETWADGADELLNALPESQREAVRLRVIEDLDYDRVADALGTSPTAARVRVHRGLEALRHRLSPSKETP
jgi:RNA polymerase sigma-70 factor, ECF subfamily